MRSPRERAGQRRGGVSLAALLLIPVLVACLVLAVFAAEAVRARSALQATADAAALAAAAHLVDDAVLTRNPTLMAILVAAARDKARQAAAGNTVLAGPTDLRDDDIEMGAREGGKFQPFDLSLAKGGVMKLPEVTTVRVTAPRTVARNNPLRLLRGPLLNRVATDVIRDATVAIDRDIIGIRPLPGVAAPLAPIALKSDPSGKDKNSWEHQTESGNGDDHWGFARVDDRLVPIASPDGLMEMHAILNGEKPNALLLQFGVHGTAELAKQLVDGVRENDLMTLGGELVFNKDGEVIVPGTSLSSGGTKTLIQALAVVRDRGEALVWPLYQRIDEETGRPVITRLVAARLAAIGTDDDGHLTIVLQPARRAVAACVTARSRGRIGEDNRYLARVRLAD